MNSQPNNSKPLEVHQSNFDLEVQKSEQPVLVAFSTRWSKACRIFGPVLDEIASLCEEKMKVVLVDPDENPDLGLRYGVRAVPTLLYFVAGEIRWRVVGTATKAAILAKSEGVSDANANSRRSSDA